MDKEKYSVAIDISSGADKSAVSIIRRGEPDELVASVSWEVGCLADAFLEMYLIGKQQEKVQ
jgi:hypothetical protein